MGGAGLQAFVGAGLAVDEELVEEEVRNAVRMELVGIIRELSGKEGYTSPSNNNTRSVFILILEINVIVILIP